MRYLRKFMEDHTVLFVSHNISSVKSLCSHAIYLKKGRMVTSGEPKQVADLYLKELYAENQKIDGTRKAPGGKAGSGRSGQMAGYENRFPEPDESAQ